MLFRSPSIVPYRSFKTADGDILFGGGNDKLFNILCIGLGKPEWAADPKFGTNAVRVQHRDELEKGIEDLTQQKTTKQWMDIFEGKGLPYAKVNDVLDTMNHEHVRARDMVVEMEHEHCGKINMINTPVKYSEARPGIRSVPPTLGEHTEEVLEGLGLTEKEVEDLRKEGAVR